MALALRQAAGAQMHDALSFDRGAHDEVLIPLMQRYPVEINADLPLQEIDGIEPEAKLFLDEREGFLMLTPLFEYDGRQVSPLHPHDIVYEEEGEITCVKRDYDYEEEMLAFLPDLVPAVQEVSSTPLCFDKIPAHQEFLG